MVKNAHTVTGRVRKKKSYGRNKKYDEYKEKEKANVTEEIYYDKIFFSDDTF